MVTAVKSVKSISHRRDRKRNTKRQRNPKTLQRFWREQLRPWLDFASLPDDPESLCRDFLRQFSVRRPRNALHRLAGRITHFGTRLAPNRHPELSELHAKICEVLDALPTMTWPTPDEEKREPLWAEHWGEAKFEMTYYIRDLGDGRVTFTDDPIPSEFKHALEGSEIRRVRRCPVCAAFFYAARKNTGACKEHLALARVRRSRDPRLREKYQRTRRINRLTKRRVPIGDAMRRLARQSQERQA